MYLGLVRFDTNIMILLLITAGLKPYIDHFIVTWGSMFLQNCAYKVLGFKQS